MKLRKFPALCYLEININLCELFILLLKLNKDDEGVGEADEAVEAIMANEDDTPDSFSPNHLPIELICKIIEYLDVNDRKNASLVCKRWRSAFLAGNFLCDVLVKANNNLFLHHRPESAQDVSLKINEYIAPGAVSKLDKKKQTKSLKK